MNNVEISYEFGGPSRHEHIVSIPISVNESSFSSGYYINKQKYKIQEAAEFLNRLPGRSYLKRQSMHVQIWHPCLLIQKYITPKHSSELQTTPILTYIYHDFSTGVGAIRLFFGSLISSLSLSLASRFVPATLPAALRGVSGGVVIGTP